VIGRDGAGGRYDYLLRYDATDLRSLSGYTTLQTIEGKEYYVVRFHSALLPLEEYSGHVWLINPHDGAPAPGMLVDLAEYVKANKIIERYGDDTYIPIHFDITGIIDPGDIVPPPPPPPPPPPDDDDPPVIPPVIPPVEGDQNVSVTVGLPPWSDNNITPELN
jgi:hypothetical protein